MLSVLQDAAQSLKATLKNGGNVSSGCVCVSLSHTHAVTEHRTQFKPTDLFPADLLCV